MDGTQPQLPKASTLRVLLHEAWIVRHAFGCILALVILSLAINQSLRFSYQNSPAFRSWMTTNSYSADLAVRSLRVLLWVSIAYLFSRLKSLRLFFQETRIDMPPTFSGWRLAWLAIAFGLLNLYMIQQRLGPANRHSESFYSTGGAIWVCYLGYLILLVPVCEEITVRGFLYGTFRRGFGLISSTVFVVCVEAYFHWGLISRSLPALSILITIGIVLCLIREHTGSTWNCVLFHSAYNATVTRQWQVVIITMIVAFVTCALTKRQCARPADSKFGLL